MTPQEYQAFSRMTSDDFHSIIRQGKDAWNNFRLIFPRNIDIVFNDVDFSGAVFTRFNLQNSRFTGCNLTGVNLTHVILSGSLFEKTDLTNAVINGGGSAISFRNCAVQGIKISGAFRNNDFRQLDFA